jgi:hypothetical protein
MTEIYMNASVEKCYVSNRLIYLKVKQMNGLSIEKFVD